MCQLFNQWENEIKDYCVKNNLDFNKAKKMPKCWGKDIVALQFIDKEKGKMGLLDDTPAPAVLWIKRINGELIFEQTEYTRKYLS